jgi:hypothetical protein
MDKRGNGGEGFICQDRRGLWHASASQPDGNQGCPSVKQPRSAGRSQYYLIRKSRIRRQNALGVTATRRCSRDGRRGENHTGE